MDAVCYFPFIFSAFERSNIMLFIDVFILTMLSILWGYLKRRMHLHDHPIREMLAILWRHIKCRMHGHSSRPATSTVTDGRQR